MTIKSFREWSPDQTYLLPPSPRDWLPQDHLVFFILAVVERLDLAAIEAPILSKDPRGERPFAPRMMVALLLYSYCTGVFSSRRIERNTYGDVATRLIAAGHHPDHSTIARFRVAHLDPLADLFVQVLQLAKAMGLAKVGRVALDGTRIKANASKHKAMSYKRMAAKKKKLAKEIRDLLAHAQKVDETEDADLGEEGLRDLPAELERRQDLTRAIDTAEKFLEEGAREARVRDLEKQAEGQEAKAADETVDPTERKRAATRARKRREAARDLRGDDDDDEPPPPASSEDDGASSEEAPDQAPPSLPERQVRHHTDGTPHERAQYNFTDPDSQILEHQGGFIQGYNAQAVANEEQLILSHGLTNVAPDTHHLQALVEGVHDNCNEYPEELLADAGYWSEGNDRFCREKGIDAYIATGREKKQAEAPTGADPPTTPRERMRAKVRGPEGRDKYKDRKWMVEPVYGQMKGPMGLQSFMLRGLDKVRGEWGLLCTAHNLLKMWRRCGLQGLAPIG